MNAKKLLAVALVALLAVASFAPAFAADKTNVLLGAECIEIINVDDTKYSTSNSETSPNGVSDAAQAVDGLYGVGPTHKDDGLNTRVIDQWLYYDEDGNEADDGLYLWSMTFDLGKVCTIDSLALMVDDLTTCGIGATTPISWVQRGFHLFVSETGEAGSWKLVLEADELHDDEDLGKFEYVEPTDEQPMGYFVYNASFDAVNAKYVKYASTCTTSDTNSYGHWINVSELEVYGTAAAGQTEDTTPVTEDTTPVTEDTTPVTEDTTPVTEDTTPVTEDTTPVTEPTTGDETEAPATFDFVIVPAIALAAAAAGAVVLKKKEN